MRLKNGAAFGVILTLLVAAMAKFGFLDQPEYWFYDQRARYCQRFTPPPTDKLVHLDIDDAAMDSIGDWAWPRSTLAEMVDEIHLAGPKAVAFDIIFHDPARVRYVPGADGKYDKIDDDQIFAASLQRLGCALIPVALPPEIPRVVTPLERALHEVLLEDLELGEQDVPAVLARRGLDDKELRKTPRLTFVNQFIQARQDAMHERLMRELTQKPLTKEQVRAILLPKTDAGVQSPAVRLLDDDYSQVKSEIALRRFSGPVPAGIPPLLHAELAMAPIASLSSAASATGFVNNPKSQGASGILRALPLFMEHDGRVYPQIGVELAAMMLDADLKSCRFTDDRIAIPCRGGQTIVVPVRTAQSATLDRPVPTMFDIPWFGPPGQWENMYDRVGPGHLSLNVVWDACLTKHRILRNNLQADDALRFLYQAFAPDQFAAFEKHPLPADDPLNRIGLIGSALAEYGPFIDDAEKTNLQDIKDEAERAKTERLAAQGRALRTIMAENPRLQSQLAGQRADLRKRLGGRAVLIGWTSTASTFDEVATSIHTKCPGVVVHGVIFNAIMTRHTWRRVPDWVNTTLILAMGLITTLLATRLLPYRALIAAALLAALYALVNGYAVFDWGHRIATLAGPIVAVAVVWAGCTLARLLTESWERARITRRFQSYVDPALVQYVIEHPELARLEGQVREMTVCFTDLVGFTSLTERLREKAVKILGRYIARMVPAIRNHRGLVHRFMGDGIMFSYGAPILNPNMAADAVTSVLEMHDELAKFNDELEAEGYPRLAIRAGVNTGIAVVGDSGADNAAEYACLGDTTNTAARLESANSALGTATLISARTVELLEGKFLVRPIARLVVKGRTEAIMTYEPLAHADSCTAKQKQLAELTTAMFEHFVAARFDACISSASALEEAFGAFKLAGIYRDLSRACLVEPPSDFRGHVMLREK